jgi:hypothetical protein
MLVTVEVINEGAFNLLSDMERLDLIRINAPAKITTSEKGTLSGQFAGTLHLSDDKYEAFQNAIQEGRNEWSRDIY